MAKAKAKELPKAKKGFPWQLEKSKGRPEKELDYYDCPFSIDIELEDFSKEFLIKLMKIWRSWYMTMNLTWYALAEQKLGTDVTGKIMIDVWLKTTAAEMEKYIPLLGKNYKTKDDLKTIEDSIKMGVLPPDGTIDKTLFAGSFDWDGPEHAKSVIHHCAMLEFFEAVDNLAPMKQLCKVQEPVCSEAYFMNPRVKMLEIKTNTTSPRKSKDEPCCIWEFKLVDK